MCQRSKTITLKKFGSLEPINVPIRSWNAISVDFIAGLPESQGYTKIWLIFDRFTKMAHFIPLTTKVPLEELARMFPQNFGDYMGSLSQLYIIGILDLHPSFE